MSSRHRSLWVCARPKGRRVVSSNRQVLVGSEVDALTVVSVLIHHYARGREALLHHLRALRRSDSHYPCHPAEIKMANGFSGSCRLLHQVRQVSFQERLDRPLDGDRIALFGDVLISRHLRLRQPVQARR